MRKNEFISYISNALAGGPLPSEYKRRYHPKLVEKQMDVAIGMIWAEYESIPDWWLAAMTKEYTVTVERSGNKQWVTLPAETFILQNYQQIRRISGVCDQQTDFTPRAIDAEWIFGDLDVNNVSESIPFTLFGDQIRFGQRLHTDIEEVELSLVVKLSAFEDTDLINIPSYKEREVTMSIVQIMLGMPKEDEVNDNAQQ